MSKVISQEVLRTLTSAGVWEAAQRCDAMIEPRAWVNATFRLIQRSTHKTASRAAEELVMYHLLKRVQENLPAMGLIKLILAPKQKT